MTTALYPVSGHGEKKHGTNDAEEQVRTEVEPEFSDEVDYALNGDLESDPSPSDQIPLTAESNNGQDEEDFEMSQRDVVDNMLGSERPERDSRSESSGKDSGEEDAADDASGQRRRARGVNEDDNDNTHNPGSGSEVGIRLGEVPRVIGYREHVIGGRFGSLVIGEAQVSLPGRGVATVTRSAFLSKDDYDPMDTVELNGPIIGGFFDTVAAPFKKAMSVATTVRDHLYPGQELRQGEALKSENGGTLILQTDGNFVLYAPDGHAIWASDTEGKPVTRVVFQKDGNLVLRSPLGYGAPEGRGWWDSGTANRGVTQLVLQTDGNLVWYKGAASAANAVSSTNTHDWKKSPGWQRDEGGFLKKAIHAVTSNPLTKVIEHTAESLTPIGLVSHLLKGERLDHALLHDVKDRLRNIKEVAPYVATISSAIPGLGTGVAAAIAMSTALAEGHPITDALLSAARGAVPGGALGQSAFDIGVRLAKGDRIDKALLTAARSQVPANLQPAFDIGLAVAHGQKLQTILKTQALPALTSLAHQALVSNVASAAKNLVKNAAGTAMAGLTVNVPGATPHALAAFGSATEALRKISDARAAVNEGEILKSKIVGRTPTLEEAATLTRARAGAVVHNAAIANIRQLQTAAQKGDPKSMAKIAILKIAKNAMEDGAGRHGHFVTDTGQILKGVFAPA
jgi:hypothetical protein